jgi:hypothetical protein
VKSFAWGMSLDMSRVGHMPDHLTLGMRVNIFVTSANSMIASSSINQCVMHQHMVSSSGLDLGKWAVASKSLAAFRCKLLSLVTREVCSFSICTSVKLNRTFLTELGCEVMRLEEGL